MSKPKTVRVAIKRTSPADAERRERQRREQQRQQIEAADESDRERRRQSEVARQGAFELAKQREARRSELAELRKAEALAAKAKRDLARQEAAKKRVHSLLEEAERLDGIRAAVERQFKVPLTTLTLPPAPAEGASLQDLERWSAEQERFITQYASRLATESSTIAINIGQRELANGVCKDIALTTRSAAVTLASFNEICLVKAGGVLDSEFKRVRADFEGHQKILEDPLLSEGILNAIKTATLELAASETELQIKQRAQKLTGLFAAATGNVANVRKNKQILEGLVSANHSLPDALQTQLAHFIDHASEISDAKLSEIELAVTRSAEVAELAKQSNELMQREADRQLIAISIRQTLENLGYEVESIGSTLFAEDGRLYATKPHWDGHFAEIRRGEALNEDQIKARCVKLPSAIRASSEAEDTQRDIEWCDDLHLAMRNLNEQGIELDVIGIDRDAPVATPMMDAEVRSSTLASAKAERSRGRKSTRHREGQS